MALEYKSKRLVSQIATSKIVLPLAALLLLIAAGCRRDKVQVYQVTTDQDQPQQTAPAPATNSDNLPPGHPDISMMNNSSAQMPSGVVPSDVQNVPPITWTTPAGWTAIAPSAMRVASFKIGGAGGQTADVSVVPLPGLGGGDFANVNRWRGQAGLPGAPDDELQNAAENVEAGGQPASLYDVAGKNPSTGRAIRILATIQHRDGTTWFFKMTGDADLVEQQKPAFLAFLKSLDFGSQQAQQSHSQLPPGHPDISSMTAASPAGPSPGQPNWTVPAGWQPLSAGQFLVAKFKINGNNGDGADVNVSSASGDGGGLAANVNRWRGQLGLPPADEIPTVTFTVPGGQAQLVDLTGNEAQTGQPLGIVAVIVTLPNQTWFYKLMGAPSVVSAQKNAFIDFVKGVQY